MDFFCCGYGCCCCCCCCLTQVHERGLAILDEEIKRLEGLIKEKKIDRDQRYQFEVKKNTYNNILYALIGR